jgi:hypothetical protein
MSLVQAIDQAVAFVQAHPDKMTCAEVEEIRRLAEIVYGLALRAGLDRALPQVPELLPQLESNTLVMTQVQFESKLNLPGDWDRARFAPGDDLLPRPSRLDEPADVDNRCMFLVCASPRWWDDMATLRARAVDAAAGVSGGNTKTESDVQATKQPTIDQHMERIALAVGDENAVRILAIAERKDWSGERKMEEILLVDRRFAGRDSNEWATLLKVSAAAVRGYGVWKGLQRAKKSES